MNDKLLQHEIKNCLSNMYAISSLMENEDNILELKKLANLMKLSVEQLNNIQNNYEISKNVKIQCDNLMINQIIDQIIDEFKPIAEKNNIKIQCCNLKYKIHTDKTKLTQVLSNLISNAIKYSVVNSTIFINIKIENGKLKIQISNLGIGLTNLEISKLGTPFYRVKKINCDGTGLGWYIIKKIVKLMKWSIVINSLVNNTVVNNTVGNNTNASNLKITTVTLSLCSA
jgi:signal transduction histidine kinase